MGEIEEITENKKVEEQKDVGPEKSFQWLMEKKIDLTLSPNDGTGHVNISLLIRDLYEKLYALETLVKSFPNNK